MADCILRGKDVKEDVKKLRSEHLEMRYCFDDAEIDEALEQLPPPQEAIEKFLCAKLRGRPLTPEDSRRLAAALQRRGFSWQDIRPALSRLGEELPED